MLTDLKKARWYLDRHIAAMETEVELLSEGPTDKNPTITIDDDPDYW